MPPIRVGSSQDSIQQEGRLLLAIQAIQNKEIRSVTEATHRFNVPRITLRRRIAGTTNRVNTRANNHKMT